MGLQVVGFIRVRVDSLESPMCRTINSGWLGFTWAGLGVVAFIRYRFGLHSRDYV